MSDTFVLLHGFTGGPASFDRLVALLPPDARVVRPTLSGHGREPARAESWAAELERLLRALDTERVDRAHLVGYSLGGRVGYGLLQRAPERFTRATLIGAHPGLRTPDECAARRAQDARWIELLETRGLPAFLDAWAALPLWASQEALPALLRAEQDVIRRGHRADGLAHALRTLGLAEMPPADPRALPMPLTLVVGELDAAHRAHSTAFAAELPRARCVVVEGAGHNVLLERPDVLARVLAEETP